MHTLIWGERGRTPLGTKERCNLPSGTTVNLYRTPYLQEESTSLKSTCDPTHASSFQRADYCKPSGTRDPWYREGLGFSVVEKEYLYYHLLAQEA